MTTTPSTKAQLQGFLADPRIVPFLNYALLIFMLVSFGLTGVVVLIISTFAEEKAPEWIKSHYEFQKRTFWVGIGPVLITDAVTAFMARHGINQVNVVAALVILTLIFIVGRCVMGFNHLLYNRPYPNPKTWTI